MTLSPSLSAVQRKDAAPARATGNHLVAQNDEREPSHLHPVFTGICQSFTTAPRIAREATMTAYIQQLRDHDWAHPMASGDVYRRGARELAELRIVQREVDPHFLVWNQHCNPACINGASYV